ncbi:uncharacterized protein N7459_007952 [Penicillium hispanicum]|uniref:uncharacterized protein n=1 Tax=Penicillium hispanicum TaxID=1080232 RepID=UPI0025407DB5|nr:uncharacterized protein N7459_007952 [Penicillium hispanicum]KAJ5573525.1 hypothetical protein N7459_007952 [Penicillium hispanicum]
MSFQSPPPLGEQIANLFEPAELMALAIRHYIRVCAEAVFQKGQVLAPIFQTSRLRDEAFGRFWIEFSALRQQAATPEAAPTTTEDATEEEQLQPPQKTGSAALLPALLSNAHGVVLDIGPGTGTQMPLLRSHAIQAIYGPEPCRGLHATLHAAAAAAGLAAKYHVLPCGAAASELLPALRATGTAVVDAYTRDAAAGVFDTIICVRVLCSVPEMERTVRELYALLKPGGRMLVLEHVVNPWRTAKGSVVARAAQSVYQMAGWSFLVGDCCLTRDTETVLRAAADGDGGWASVELERWFEWSPMPHLSGVLVKKTA